MEWYQDHDNLALTARYMADNGYTASDLAYFTEKPWKYEDEFTKAKALSDHENAGLCSIPAGPKYCSLPANHAGRCVCRVTSKLAPIRAALSRKKAPTASDRALLAVFELIDLAKNDLADELGTPDLGDTVYDDGLNSSDSYVFVGALESAIEAAYAGPTP